MSLLLFDSESGWKVLKMHWVTFWTFSALLIIFVAKTHEQMDKKYPKIATKFRKTLQGIHGPNTRR